jgi:hypothetical protein
MPLSRLAGVVLAAGQGLAEPAPLDDAVEADAFQDPVQDAGDELGHEVADEQDEQGGGELGHEGGHIGPGVLDAALEVNSEVHAQLLVGDPSSAVSRAGGRHDAVPALSVGEGVLHSPGPATQGLQFAATARSLMSYWVEVARRDK